MSRFVGRLGSGRLSRPSPGIVVAVLALLLSVAGNAAAAVVISSNAQVAQNTIAGHHPPSGKHPNIIGGSITEGDLAALPVWHSVHPHGAAAPSFECVEVDACWVNSTAFADLPTAGFYKWHGEVHLKGNVCVTQNNGGKCVNDVSHFDSAMIFRLPVGFRPAHTPLFIVASNELGTIPATVVVQASTGYVIAREFSWQGVDLNSISFRVDN